MRALRGYRVLDTHGHFRPFPGARILDAMSDPLTDPRGRDLMRAVPDDIKLLTSVYLRAAGEAQFTARGLRAAANDTKWTGKAADSFRASIGHFPRQLDRVCTGYWEVALALQAYERRLPELQREFQLVSGNLRDARTQLAQARGGESQARQALTDDLKRVSHASRRTKRTDQQTVLDDAGLVTHWQTVVDSRRKHANEILDEFERIRRHATATVSRAASIAIPAKPQPHHASSPHTGAGGAGGGHGGHPGTTARAGGAGGHSGGGHNGRSGGGHNGHSGGGHDGAVPTTARAKVEKMTATANRLLGTPYVYGGGHGSTFGPSGGGLDCSGFVSTVLHSAGYLHTPEATDGIPGQQGIADGPGKYVTIYDRVASGDNDHVIIDINGQFYEEGGSGGPQNAHKFTPTRAYLDSFNRILHPAGL